MHFCLERMKVNLAFTPLFGPSELYVITDYGCHSNVGYKLEGDQAIHEPQNELG
jgi:hypothetical protein